MTPRATVIIPAHNEADVIDRCLQTVVADQMAAEVEIIVVTNGCTDDTAARAAAYPGVRVIDADVSSKTGALNAGDAIAGSPHRIYLDADVAFGPRTLTALVEHLENDDPTVASPKLDVESTQMSRPARLFYFAWLRSPFFSDGMIGTGCYAISAGARERFGAFPPMQAEDMFVHVLFGPEERATVPEPFSPLMPATVRDILRVEKRHSRSRLALAEYLRDEQIEAKTPATHGKGWLLRLAADPRHWPGLATFITVRLICAISGRWSRMAGKSMAWETDRSSRSSERGDPEQLRMLARPGPLKSGANPYTALFASSLRDLGVQVEEWSLKRSFLRRYDVVHVHWPDMAINTYGGLKRRVAQRVFLGSLRWAKRRGATITWTAHDVRPLDTGHATSDLYFDRFARLVDGVIAMNVASVDQLGDHYPALADTPARVIRHGHNREWMGAVPTRAEARSNLGVADDARLLLYLGMIKPYKDVPGLVTAFGAVTTPDAQLWIAGEPSTREIAHAIGAAAADDDRVRLDLEFVTDERMIQLMAAADAVALPYREIYNSGAAITALSLERRVLAPAFPALSELGVDVGNGWITLTDGPITADAIATTLAAADPVAGPDLSSLDWDGLAKETLRFLTDLRAVRRGSTPMEPLVAVADLRVEPRRPVYRRVPIGAAEIDGLTLDDAAEVIIDSIRAGEGGWAITHNINHLRSLADDERFAEQCSTAELRLADGVPLVWASKVAGNPLPGRVNGTDLMERLCERLAQEDLSLALSGGADGARFDAAEALSARHPGISIVGLDPLEPGWRDNPDWPEVLTERIRGWGADVVFVGLPADQQADFMEKLSPRLPTTWLIGVGVSFSFVSGELPRAPEWAQRAGLEWLHRWSVEPERLTRRYVGDMPFAARLMLDSAKRRVTGS